MFGDFLSLKVISSRFLILSTLICGCRLFQSLSFQLVQLFQPPNLILHLVFAAETQRSLVRVLARNGPVRAFPRSLRRCLGRSIRWTVFLSLLPLGPLRLLLQLTCQVDLCSSTCLVDRRIVARTEVVQIGWTHPMSLLIDSVRDTRTTLVTYPYLAVVLHVG